MRVVLGVLAAGALLLSVQGAASGAGLDTPPPDCGAVGKDYTDPTCTAQTRNGTFTLGPRTVRPGETLTGTVSNRCLAHSTSDFSQPPDMPCPIDWTELVAVGKKVSGCAEADDSCTVRISEEAKATPYTILTVGITSNQGTGISKDYYRIVGGKAKRPIPDWDFPLRPFCGKDLCVIPTKLQTNPNLSPYWRQKADGYYSKYVYSVPTGRGTETKLRQYRPKNTPISWKGANKDFFQVNLNVQAPFYVISAHGAWAPSENGYTRVPQGTQVVTYVPLGTSMDGSLGPSIDTGKTTGMDNRYKVTYEAGDIMPNFTFTPFDGTEGKYAKNVDSETTLNTELRPDMGTVAISACATIFLPPDKTLAETLASAPVYTPGSTTPTTIPAEQRPTVTPSGQLQVRDSAGR